MSKDLTSRLRKKVPRPGEGLYYDPLYGHIPVSSEIRRLIDLEIFQRLRGIKQLSTLYLVFPGAVHTRFEHSIGVSYLAQILHQRLTNYVAKTSQEELKNIEFNEITLRAMELAAVLHDIGHGPFGHVFEMACRRNRKYSSWTHEKLGKRLITGKDENYKELCDPIYRQIPLYLEDLQYSLRNKAGNPDLLALLKPGNISNLCFGQAPQLPKEELTRRYFFLKDIVPSAYGIDRLDYLRRDAFHTGVKTGDIDIWEIIGNLHLRRHKENCQLFLLPSASVAVESLLRSRDAVYRHLYHNPIHRSSQELLIRALLELDRDPNELALLTDFELLETLANSSRPFLKDAAERIRFRILYEVLPIGSHEFLHKFEPQIKEFWNTPDGWREFTGKEETIGNGVGLTSPNKVFYDLERIPAIKEEDLTSQIFFDPIAKEPKDLYQLQSHIANLYKGTEFGNTTKVHAYNDRVSNFFLSFPYDHIAKEIEKISADIAHNRVHPQTPAERIMNLYEDKLKPLLDGFFCKILECDPDPEISRNFKANLVHYLQDLVSVNQAYGQFQQQNTKIQ